MKKKRETLSLLPALCFMNRLALAEQLWQAFDVNKSGRLEGDELKHLVAFNFGKDSIADVSPDEVDSLLAATMPDAKGYFLSHEGFLDMYLSGNLKDADDQTFQQAIDALHDYTEKHLKPKVSFSFYTPYFRFIFPFSRCLFPSFSRSLTVKLCNE